MLGADLTALEALGLAIRAEIDACELYGDLAKRVRNPLVREKFELLAKEESQHQRILEKAYEQHFPEVPLQVPRTQLSKEYSCTSLREQKSLKDVLAFAISEERRSHERYLKAAEQAKDPSGQAMFHYLADWEFSHQMALTAEYEMLVRYPRHFGQDIEPWRPEFGR